MHRVNQYAMHQNSGWLFPVAINHFTRAVLYGKRECRDGYLRTVATAIVNARPNKVASATLAIGAKSAKKRIVDIATSSCLHLCNPPRCKVGEFFWRISQNSFIVQLEQLDDENNNLYEDKNSRQDYCACGVAAGK